MFNSNSLNSQTVEPLEHTFTLRNDTRAALALDHLQTSCTCTTAALEGTTDGATIAPGGTFSVHVSIDPLRLVPGLLHKSVWVFVKGQDAPAATLEMTGALLPAVSFSPPSLSFGRIEKGTELTLLLRMTSQTTRMEQGSELRLISADPDVSVTEAPPDASNAAGEAMPMTRAFRVRLAPHAHVGRLQGQLSLILAHTGDPSDATGPVVNTISWRGDAAGEIAANPEVVAFGITTGQELIRKIILSGSAIGNSSKPFTLSSTNPYVTATLKPLPSRTATKPTTSIVPNASGQAANSQMEVDVHLDKHVPTGPLDAKVTPQAFLLNPHNEVVFAGIPDDSRRYQARTGTWGVTHSYLAQAIAQALAGKPVSVSRVREEGCIIAW